MPIIDVFPRERSLSLPSYKVYRHRFYVLFIFAFLSFNQSLFWITFAPISDSTQTHYHITEATVDLLLAWGPICFIVCLPLTYLLLNRHNGIRYCVIVLAITDLVATIIRIIPSVVISSSNPRFSAISLAFLHAGQILNAACGPLAMAPVSQLSCLWFDTNERTRATTVAIMAYNLGSTVGFIMGPAVVYSPEHISRLLYIHVGLAFVACVLALIYFPGQPPTPPSPAAELLIRGSVNEEGVKSWRFYAQSLQRCFTTPSFILLVLAGGLIGGTYGVWTSLFSTILEPEHYSESHSGWFGFSSSIAEIIGGLVLSWIADMPRFHRSFKILIVISFVCYFLSVSWFNLSIHTLFFEEPLLPSTTVTIALSVTLAGLFQGAASPLTYEALAEIMYPLPESLSASILVEFMNITSLVLFFIAPNRYKVMNLTIIIIIAICIVLAASTRFHYKRRDADRTKRNTLVPADIDPDYDMNLTDSIRPVPHKDSILDDIQMDPMHDTSYINPTLDMSDA